MVWGPVINPDKLPEPGRFKEHKTSWKAFQHLRELPSKPGGPWISGRRGGIDLFWAGLVSPLPSGDPWEGTALGGVPFSLCFPSHLLLAASRVCPARSCWSSSCPKDWGALHRSWCGGSPELAPLSLSRVWDLLGGCGGRRGVPDLGPALVLPAGWKREAPAEGCRSSLSP